MPNWKDHFSTSLYVTLPTCTNQKVSSFPERSDQKLIAPLSSAIMGIASIPGLLLGAILHPSEAKALINYSIWRDPLQRLEDNPEATGW